jgi:hypothetical protein
MSRLNGANKPCAGGVGGGGLGGGGGSGDGGGDGGAGGVTAAAVVMFTTVAPAHASKPAAAHAWRMVTFTAAPPALTHVGVSEQLPQPTPPAELDAIIVPSAASSCRLVAFVQLAPGVAAVEHVPATTLAPGGTMTTHVSGATYFCSCVSAKGAHATSEDDAVSSGSGAGGLGGGLGMSAKLEKFCTRTAAAPPHAPW